VLRYVERNPARAGLVIDAADWPWSSLSKAAVANRLVDPGPVDRPSGWREYVNDPLTAAELDAVRRTVNRNAPFGEGKWVEGTAIRLGLEASLRPTGRPRSKP
jgi:putative transposase